MAQKKATKISKALKQCDKLGAALDKMNSQCDAIAVTIDELRDLLEEGGTEASS